MQNIGLRDIGTQDIGLQGVGSAAGSCLLQVVPSRRDVGASGHGHTADGAHHSRMRYDQMRMYQAAELLAREVDGLLPEVRRFAPNAAWHLERSTESVVYNTAEGIAAAQPGTKANAYGVARKEANEVRSILRRMRDRGILRPDQIRKAWQLATVCISMTTRAIMRMEQRGKGNAPQTKAEPTRRPDPPPSGSPPPPPRPASQPDVPDPDVPHPDVPHPDAPHPDVPHPDVPHPDVQGVSPPATTD